MIILDPDADIVDRNGSPVFAVDAAVNNKSDPELGDIQPSNAEQLAGVKQIATVY